MADDDIWICPGCGKPCIEDSQMWVDPDRCPYCGHLLHDDQDKES